MFAYCQNNPVYFSDPNGLCRVAGPNFVEVLDCGQTDCRLSRFYIENETIRNIAKVLETFVTNIDVEVGIGLGLYLEKDFEDFLSVSAGIRYDLINVGFSNGRFYCNQAFFNGIEGTALWVFDFDVHSQNQLRESPFAKEMGLWRDDTSNDIWVVDGTGAYFFGGGRYHIGIDVISFFEDIHSVFQ